MTYRINVAKDDGPNWNNTDRSYRYYFNVETELFGDALKDLVNEIRNQWPAPGYRVEVSKHKTYRETVEI